MIAFCQADAELNVLVYFDLKTTDATNDIQICQIAGIGPDQSTYNAYILPTSCISSRITSIKKLKVYGNVLLYNDQPVVTVSLKNALLRVLEWMNSLANNIIYKHNSKAFDCVHFINALVLNKVDITEFHKVIFTGFHYNQLSKNVIKAVIAEEPFIYIHVHSYLLY